MSIENNKFHNFKDIRKIPQVNLHFQSSIFFETKKNPLPILIRNLNFPNFFQTKNLQNTTRPRVDRIYKMAGGDSLV